MLRCLRANPLPRLAALPCARPAQQRVSALAARRCLSSDAVATRGPKEDAVSTEEAPAVDKETMSAFTGAPAEMMETRVVKIYQQAQTVQNATQNMIPWRLQWEDDQTKRWANPLMGWTSTSDPLSNTHMTVEFATVEDAARFCDQNGAPPPSPPPSFSLCSVQPTLSLLTRAPRDDSPQVGSTR